jgi:hypothetical protein
MEQIFSDIYERGYWGSNMESAYRGSSGSGSDPEYNRPYISWLRGFIHNRKIQSVVDLGCGDFRCGPLIYDGLNLTYTGLDVYRPMIHFLQSEYPEYQFMHLNVFSNVEEVPPGDLCILKDVLQHWSNQDITGFLESLIRSKKFRWILICNCAQQKHVKNIKTGYHRQLSSAFRPLSLFNPTVLFRYETKEVSLIDCAALSMTEETRASDHQQDSISALV